MIAKKGEKKYLNRNGGDGGIRTLFLGISFKHFLFKMPFHRFL